MIKTYSVGMIDGSMEYGNGSASVYKDGLGEFEFFFNVENLKLTAHPWDDGPEDADVDFDLEFTRLDYYPENNNNIHSIKDVSFNKFFTEKEMGDIEETISEKLIKKEIHKNG